MSQCAASFFLKWIVTIRDALDATALECPVCKAGRSDEKVIPVYARRTEAVDPRLVVSNDFLWAPSKIHSIVAMPERSRPCRTAASLAVIFWDSGQTQHSFDDDGRIMDAWRRLG
ncbi:hypothetical protein PsorP6_013486 [Peronosclerospora sorghi]|uniref:Uncharacterized protein n=1 Tax=Peronosclerospora sorghi TaxID=230839 RepID=A0ACC0VGR7_9STRA|nr:hypothetical protein PsorP6_013486 [Peronosclerospora sorghi]